MGYRCLHTTGLAVFGENVLHAGIRINLRPVGRSPGQIGHQHGLLAFGLAARQAVPGQAALADIALQRFHRPTQAVGTGADQAPVTGNLMLTVFMDGQVLFHFVEIGRQLRRGQVIKTKIPLPVLQDEIRRTETHTAIDHRGAPHTGALQHQQIAAAVGLAAMVLIQGVQAVSEPFGEVL